MKIEASKKGCEKSDESRGIKRKEVMKIKASKMGSKKSVENVQISNFKYLFMLLVPQNQ